MGDKIGCGIAPFLALSISYFIVDWRVAFAVGVWMWPAMILGNRIWIAHSDADYFGMSQFWFMGLVNALSWIAQFIGHGVFEQRAPAILTNLAYSLLAPLFITFEVMNQIFGFQEGKQMKRLRRLIA